MSGCVSQLFVVINILDKNNLEEEKFFLAYHFRGLNLWSADSFTLDPRKDRPSWRKYMVEESCVAHDSQEAEREVTGTR